MLGAQVDKALLGVGWFFPPQINADGDITTVGYEEDIQQSIQIILGTAYGERLMRPDFGAGLQSLIFEPIDTTTMALVQHHVEEALIAWEPRIDNISVQVNPDSRQSHLLINIHYRVRITNTFYNLVYPFYLMEGKEQ